MTDVTAQIEDLKKRLNRLEAAFQEMVKGASVYTNDKAYDERELKKERTQ